MRKAIAAAIVLLPHIAHAQVLISPAFLYNHVTRVKEDSIAVRGFTPVAPWGGLPTVCLQYQGDGFGMPSVALYGPSWESRLTATFVWTDGQRRMLRAQIVRHREALPIKDPTTGAIVVDPITSLTPHTVISIDFADSTFVAYNLIGDSARDGVGAKLGTLTSSDVLGDSLKQLAAAETVCKLTPRQPGPPTAGR
jgi:hypothetical protein